MFAKKGLSAAPAAVPQYVEDVFSTYLYTGNGSTQTITNGIDLSGEGGLVWIKQRTDAAHALYDTVRGVRKAISSNFTLAESTASSGNELTAFNSNGFSLGTDSNYNVNSSSTNYASWTFRKAEKFFDVVTFTGTGSNQQISHNLGSAPGCIIVKNTSAAQAWYVYHRSLSTPADNYLVLNTTAASTTISGLWGTVSSTQFGFVGNSSQNYVAYLFAHDAGGFGDAGDQSVISCGSVTATGGNVEVNLGWEPQWVLVKNASVSENWRLLDNMRGITNAGTKWLFPNTSGAETDNSGWNELTATGFKLLGWGSSGNNYIYIAIRRGPMKTPTSGTSVFTPVVRTGTNGTTSYTGLSFSPDLVIGKARANTYSPAPTYTTKLTGTNAQLGSSSTNGESTASDAITGWLNTGYNLGADNSLGNYNLSTTSNNYVTWNFRRSPGFFDVVTYAGTGSAGATTSHNLGVSPELIITKVRNFTGEDWIVHYRNGSTITAGYLNTTAAFAASGSAPSTDLTNFTSTSYERNTGNRRVNGSYNYVAYLFASLSGISKIGTYTGNGGVNQINCGFTSGARFVMIKRTDDAYPWYVWDSARGIVSGNDPYIRINQTSAEVTDQDDIDPYSSGFELSSAALGINASGGTYIYLAIA